MRLRYLHLQMWGCEGVRGGECEGGWVRMTQGVNYPGAE